MAERRRLERNLHDGAQQRLVSLALTLRHGPRTSSPATRTAPAELLDGAAHELEQALAELRELARGIHPAVLSDRGLPAALETLAGRSPVPRGGGRAARPSGCRSRWSWPPTTWSPRR